MSKLKNKVAVITGDNSSIGYATAKEFNALHKSKQIEFMNNCCSIDFSLCNLLIFKYLKTDFSLLYKLFINSLM
jgi:hypothetical protein